MQKGLQLANLSAIIPRVNISPEMGITNSFMNAV